MIQKWWNFHTAGAAALVKVKLNFNAVFSSLLGWHVNFTCPWGYRSGQFWLVESKFVNAIFLSKYLISCAGNLSSINGRRIVICRNNTHRGWPFSSWFWKIQCLLATLPFCPRGKYQIFRCFDFREIYGSTYYFQICQLCVILIFRLWLDDPLYRSWLLETLEDRQLLIPWWREPFVSHLPNVTPFFQAYYCGHCLYYRDWPLLWI